MKTIAGSEAGGGFSIRSLNLNESAMRQTRRACGRPDKFNFHGPDEIWEAAQHVNKLSRYLYVASHTRPIGLKLLGI
jgi:hypothetical protein